MLIKLVRNRYLSICPRCFMVLPLPTILILHTHLSYLLPTPSPLAPQLHPHCTPLLFDPCVCSEADCHVLYTLNRIS